VFIVIGTPGYVKGHGTLECAEDLFRHACERMG
jgi:hypothetical protein